MEFSLLVSVLLSSLVINILVCMLWALWKLFVGGRMVGKWYWQIINSQNSVLALLQLFHITIDESFVLTLLFRLCTICSHNEIPTVLSQLHVSRAGVGSYCQICTTCSGVYTVLFTSVVGKLRRKPCMFISLEIVWYTWKIKTVLNS